MKREARSVTEGPAREFVEVVLVEEEGVKADRGREWALKEWVRVVARPPRLARGRDETNDGLARWARGSTVGASAGGKKQVSQMGSESRERRVALPVQPGQK